MTSGNTDAAVAMALILVLATSPLPVAAQEPGLLKRPGVGAPGSQTSMDPIARSAAREALELTPAADAPTDSPAAGVEPGRPGPSDWSRVLDLSPGTEIIVIVNGARPATRYLIAHSDSQLTLLNLTEATLPVAARDALRNVALHHPAHYAAAQQGTTFVLGRGVRLEREGVFVADTKVGDLTQFIEHVGRSEVVEIATASRTRSWLGCGFAGYGGWWIGGTAGGVTGAYIGRSFTGLVLGMIAGGFTGASLLYHKCRHKSEEVIYRAQ